MTIYDGRQSFYQWDLNQRLIGNFKVGDEVHFNDNLQETALVVLAYEFGGKIVADVPNILLQQAYPITAYRYVYDGTSAYTIEERTFNVEERVKPSDYVYVETELYTITTAVNKALENTKQMCGNAIKATASGEIVKVDDVSPIDHIVKVNANSKNLFDTSKINVWSAVGNNACVSQSGNGSVTVHSPNGHSGYCGTKQTLRDICGDLEIGKAYILTGETQATGRNYIYLDGAMYTWWFGKTLVFTEEHLNSTIVFYGYNKTGGDCVISNIQLELGNTATEYTPYIDPTTVTVTRYGVDENDNPQTYTPNTDGTVNIVSLSPTMTLLTDNAGVTIEAEYNQDANLVIGKLQTQLNELRTIIDELKG